MKLLDKKIINKDFLNEIYPIGSIFIRRYKVKKPMPYFKWKFIGMNIYGDYLYKRVK